LEVSPQGLPLGASLELLIFKKSMAFARSIYGLTNGTIPKNIKNMGMGQN
jgi:hypothetical protein